MASEKQYIELYQQAREMICTQTFRSSLSLTMV